MDNNDAQNTRNWYVKKEGEKIKLWIGDLPSSSLYFDIPIAWLQIRKGVMWAKDYISFNDLLFLFDET